MRYNKTKYYHLHEEWATLYQSGLSTLEIAKQFNCDRNNILLGLRRLGVTIRKHKPAIERYYDFVVKKEGCWGWKGALNSAGYGLISINGKDWRAHRYSYLIHKEDPKGRFVCHSCDNPACSNPDHLFLGDSSSNFIDCLSKKRTPIAKLSPDNVIEIRTLLNNNVSAKEIAHKFNIGSRTVYHIKSNERWSHVN